MADKARVAVMVSSEGTNLQALIDAQRAGLIDKGEIALAQDMLDLYANYIRMHQDKLELAEILEISALLDQYGMLTIRWEKGDFAFRRNEISLQQAQEIIEKKNGL